MTKENNQNDSIVVDMRGTVCPAPVIETKRAVDSHPNMTIETLVDNEVSRDNVEKFGNAKGFVTIVTEEGQDYRVTLVPVGAARPNGAGLAEGIADTTRAMDTNMAVATTVATTNATNPGANAFLAGDQPQSAGRVLLMTKDYLGEGNQDLGRNLMKTFWACMAEADSKPKAIYFINSSVKMVAQDSVHLPHLKALAEAGVAIAACGICLDFYGLKDQVAVGSITNMYAITDAILGENLVKL